ncbi:hypothetical protein [Haloprofundus halobius]|uniref:hypothetical protein n=1 Tax=Haloprofundus halobius TaxID=2876194 RepID=UPI001CCF5C2D|nr:hypothetical protein [Haloprofundus halobius]
MDKTKTVERTKQRYVDGEIDEDELEEQLDQADFEAEDSEKSTWEEISEHVDPSGVPFRMMTTCFLMILWLASATVFQALGEAGTMPTENAMELFYLMTALSPAFIWMFVKQFDDILRPAKHIKPVRHVRYALSLFFAGGIYTSTSVPLDAPAEMVQMSRSMSLMFALLTAVPALTMYVEDNADAIEAKLRQYSWGRRLME